MLNKSLTPTEVQRDNVKASLSSTFILFVCLSVWMTVPSNKKWLNTEREGKPVKLSYVHIFKI